METSGMEPEPWWVVGSKELLRTPWFVLRQDQVRLPSGKVLDDFYIWEHPDWVNVIAITKDRKIVMVQQYRHGIQAVHYELPGGIWDPTDCDAETAARRELLEETGFGGGVWQPWLSVAPNPASLNNMAHTFLARDVELVGAKQLDDSEDIVVQLVSCDELPTVFNQGRIVHALHVAALMKLLVHFTTPTSEAASGQLGQGLMQI